MSGALRLGVLRAMELAAGKLQLTRVVLKKLQAWDERSAC
jgi:hypothetical protein